MKTEMKITAKQLVEIVRALKEAVDRDIDAELEAALVRMHAAESAYYKARDERRLTSVNDLKDEWYAATDAYNALYAEKQQIETDAVSPEEREATEQQRWAVYGGDPDKNPRGLGT